MLKPEIITELERLRDIELEERREKRKKAAEEEAAKKKEQKSKEENSSKVSTQATVTAEDEPPSQPEPPVSLGTSTPTQPRSDMEVGVFHPWTASKLQIYF